MFQAILVTNQCFAMYSRMVFGWGGLEAQQYKMVVNQLSRPEPILRTQLLNELSHIGSDFGPPFLPGLPAPLEYEFLSMPLHTHGAHK